MKENNIIAYLGQFEHLTPVANVAATNSNGMPARQNNDLDHIFYAILEYALRFSSDKTKYTYYYSLSQKLLRACHLGENKVATYFLEKFEGEKVSREQFENDVSYQALHSIFNPAIAYYYYHVKHDYVSAEKCMINSLANIDFLIEHGFDDGVYMKIEQQLNTFRVYFNAGEYDKAILYARKVMPFLLSSEKETYQFPFSKVLRNQKQLHSILNLFFNGIIFKTLGKASEDNFFQNNILVSIFSDLDVSYNEMLDGETAKTIDAFILILKNRAEEAADKIMATNVFDKSVPRSLRYFILSFLLQYGDVKEKLPEHLNNSIFTYQKDELNLSDAQLKITGTQPVEA
jgi:hypothetical protein